MTRCPCTKGVCKQGTSFFYKVLSSLKQLQSQKKYGNGASSEDLAKFMDKMFHLNGDIVTQVENALCAAVSSRFVIKKKNLYSFVSPAAILQFTPDPCVKAKLERIQEVFNSRWYESCKTNKKRSKSYSPPHFLHFKKTRSPPATVGKCLNQSNCPLKEYYPEECSAPCASIEKKQSPPCSSANSRKAKHNVKISNPQSSSEKKICKPCSPAKSRNNSRSINKKRKSSSSACSPVYASKKSLCSAKPKKYRKVNSSRSSKKKRLSRTSSRNACNLRSMRRSTRKNYSNSTSAEGIPKRKTRSHNSSRNKICKSSSSPNTSNTKRKRSRSSKNSLPSKGMCCFRVTEIPSSSDDTDSDTSQC